MIVSLLKNGGLFSDYKFVLLNNAEEIEKSEIPLLISYIKAPSRTGTLVLLTDSYQVDSRISGAVGEKNIRVFWELFENQKEGWVRSYFSKEGMSVSSDAVEMILDMVNNRTDDLEIVCGRLVSFLRESGEITERDVENFVFHSKEENVFTLFAKMAEKNFPGSIEVLHKIGLSGDHNPVQDVERSFVAVQKFFLGKLQKGLGFPGKGIGPWGKLNWPLGFGGFKGIKRGEKPGNSRAPS